jgi:hypothetical protein
MSSPIDQRAPCSRQPRVIVHPAAPRPARLARGRLVSAPTPPVRRSRLPVSPRSSFARCSSPGFRGCMPDLGSTSDAGSRRGISNAPATEGRGAFGSLGGNDGALPPPRPETESQYATEGTPRRERDGASDVVAGSAPGRRPCDGRPVGVGQNSGPLAPLAPGELPVVPTPPAPPSPGVPTTMFGLVMTPVVFTR